MRTWQSSGQHVSDFTFSIRAEAIAGVQTLNHYNRGSSLIETRNPHTNHSGNPRPFGSKLTLQKGGGW